MCLGWLTLMTIMAGSAQAQNSGAFGASPGSGASRTYNFSGVGSYFSGSPTYIPFSSAMGGFIPYSPGPGGGLGVLPGMRNIVGPPQRSAMGFMLGTRSGLGALRSEITPLAPIGLGSMGSRGSGGMSSMGGLIRRTPSGGSMRGTARPPVGNYPFRQPPGLLGPASATPSMSM